MATIVDARLIPEPSTRRVYVADVTVEATFPERDLGVDPACWFDVAGVTRTSGSNRELR